jgi:hypothetical protein
MGRVKKSKKKERDRKKNLGPLTDSLHLEAEERKKLWKLEPREGMDSQHQFSGMGDPATISALLDLKNLWE